MPAALGKFYRSTRFYALSVHCRPRSCGRWSTDRGGGASCSDEWEWEDDDVAGCQEEEIDDHTRSVIHFLSLFIVRFQIIYRVSEKAILFILKLFGAVLAFLAAIIQHKLLPNLARVFPVSLHFVCKYAALNQVDFTAFVVCPVCHKLYDPKSKLTIKDSCGIEMSSKCSFVAFPNHPHHSRRHECGEKLIKKVKCKGNMYKFMPRSVYCYYRVK